MPGSRFEQRGHSPPHVTEFQVTINGPATCAGSEAATIKRNAEISLSVKCRINRIEQSRVAEWLEQALARTLFDQPLANQNICISRNENDRNRKSPSY
jgi:hypothetical protein